MTVAEMAKELWRLRLNWFITLLLSPLLYSVSFSGYLSSFHRFVTNPKLDDLNVTQQSKIEPGLGELEFFYSLLIAALNFGAVLGSVSTGLLSKYVPFFYLFMIAFCSHILGYVLYGVSSQGWLLMIAELLAGFFMGAQSVLSYSYAVESSLTYAELLRRKGEKVASDKHYPARVRNYLFSSKVAGNGLGFVLGTGTALILTHLQVDQFRSIAWVNVGFGVTVLIVLILMFRGESSWKKLNQCHLLCKCSKQDLVADVPGPLQLLIIITMTLLIAVDVAKWGFFETLPTSERLIWAFIETVLILLLWFQFCTNIWSFVGSHSESFVLIISVIVLIFAPKNVANLALNNRAFLQKIKLSSQVIGILGLLSAILGYLIITDWQAIPYDPCTAYSPFHHPEYVKNLSSHLNGTQHQLIGERNSALNHSLLVPISLHLYSNVELRFDNGNKGISHFPAEVTLSCLKNQVCPVCGHTNDHSQLCLPYLLDPDGDISPLKLPLTGNLTLPPEIFSCGISILPLSEVCINLYHSQSHSVQNQELPQIRGHIQSLQVLSDSVYSSASNACMNADVPNRQCHWIPFSTIAKKKCEDCQPICRSREQTLSFLQFLIGMALLLATNSLIMVPATAIISNQTPLDSQGLMFSIVGTGITISQSISPLSLDGVYEGSQKRLFVATLLLVALHIPFIAEFILLYRKLGPNSQHGYSKANKEDSSNN